MIFTTVLDVGDGACAVIDPGDGAGITVIDCGTWRSRSDKSSKILAEDLGDSLIDLESMIVTHFDADHWLGFLKLAPIYGSLPSRDRQNRRVMIYYPGMPLGLGRLPAATLALISTSCGITVKAMDLQSEWRTVVKTDAMTLYKGDTITSSCHTWDILWPPRQLPAKFGIGISRHLLELGELADELAGLGFSLLRDNLREAYDLWDEGDTDRPLQEDKRLSLPSDPAIHGINDDSADFLVDTEAAGPYGYVFDRLSNGGSAFDEVPAEYKEKLKSLSVKLNSANNLLSLVVAQDNSFISFGDVQRWALKAVLADTRQHYCMVLAPHHGTVPVPETFPTACVCVAQLGGSHISRWDRHRKTHAGGGSCTTTFESDIKAVRICGCNQCCLSPFCLH